MAWPTEKDVILAVPFIEKERAKDLARPGEIHWSEEATTWYFSPTKTCPNLPESLYKYLSSQGIKIVDKFFLSVPYSKKTDVDHFGISYDRRWKAPYWPGKLDSLPKDLQCFLPLKYSWEAHVNELHQGTSGQCRSNNFALPDVEEKKVASEVLRASMDEYPGFIIVANPGIRRMKSTWHAAIAATQGEPSKALIVCLQADVAAWRDVLDEIGTLRADVIIVAYENLKYFFETSHGPITPRSLRGVAHFGKPQEFDLIVWDNAHLLRNAATGRSGMAIKMANEANFNIWVSALPAYRVSEMLFLLNVLKKRTNWGNPDTLPNEKDLAAWCGKNGFSLIDAEEGRLFWEYPLPEETSIDAQKLHSILFRRDHRGTLAAYALSKADAIVEFNILNQSGWDESIVNLINNDHDSLRKLSLHRMDVLVEKAKTMISEGNAVIIVSDFPNNFFANAQLLKESGFNYSLITEKTFGADREKEAFQSSKNKLLLVQSGLNIDLSGLSRRPRIVMFAEPVASRDKLISETVKFTAKNCKISVMVAHSNHISEKDRLNIISKQMMDGTIDHNDRRWKIW